MAGEHKKFHHLGHLVIECFRKRPNAICRIDAATGASETNGSVLSRTVQLASCFRTFGLVPGDVVSIGGKNHLDLNIPLYSALYNGLPLVGVDPLFKYEEIKSLLKLASPKISFCDQEDYENYTQAVKDLGLSTLVVTYGSGEHSMDGFLQKYKPAQPVNEYEFELAEFDPEKVFMWLISTSGTTGSVKVAAFTHHSWYEKGLAYSNQIKTGSNNDEDNRLALSLSPCQWVSGIFNQVGMPLLRQTIVQTSAPATVEHVIDIINKYRPEQTLIGPAIISKILNHEKKCDLTCFKFIIIGGAHILVSLLQELRSRLSPGAIAVEMYGQTETLGPALFPHAKTPPGSCGSPVQTYQVQLKDPDTGAVITEPNVNGELCIKGILFSEYYNNPVETKNAFTDDGWYKTGDLFYKDENENYFYVSRIKMLLKYQNYHIIPSELEDEIRKHPAVSDVVVTGLENPPEGDLAVACVVVKEGATVTEDEIKALVANNLSEKKQLRGGVLFLKEFPLTSTGKVSLKEVKNIVKKAFSS